MEARTWLWIAFGVIVVGILVFDLGVVGRQKSKLELKPALLLAGVYVSLALAFGVAVLFWIGADAGLQYYTAYVLEESLSLDNIFLWVLVFQQLKVPDAAQHKVLFWGIMGAIVLRGVFIFAGTALVQSFEWVLYIFGVLVLFSGIKLLRGGGAENDVGNSRVLKFLRRYLDVTEHYEGNRFLVRHDGRLNATPLLAALVVIETTDIVFALDSIPAIFGITQDRFVVYTSNVFAVIGLRALYFTVANLVEHLRYLRYGLSLLLILIGAKMIAGGFVEIPVWLTLGATVAILGGAIGLSLMHRESRSAERHPAA
ncbi:MAG TPA: TerC/Alx family metal homeostasis membrane protein [Alphaproteobacteria bacterium]|nr:TerC/Alx family metal homeostasis membrane protein [Alphaproteobacteria bacterium]